MDMDAAEVDSQTNKVQESIGKLEKTTLIDDDEEGDAADEGDSVLKNPKNHSRKPRKRKKQVYNQIRQQMEFYFSDANLTKDRFLNKLVAEDPYVPLAVFMSFNKVKKLVKSIEDIEKSLTTSDVLKLSEDGTKVRRITEITASPADVDERTIYVEALPTTATHDWVRTTFEQYGPVAYVSLPKYRLSQRIKEFAFVEFEHRNSVLKAISKFKTFGGVINTDCNPENLKSISTFTKEEADPSKNIVPTANANDEDVKVNAAERTNEEDEEVASNVDEQSETASATHADNLEDLTDVSDADTGPVPAKRIKLDGESTGEPDENAAAADDSAAVAKRKKVRRKKTAAKNHKNNFDENPASSINELRITTKDDWKKLRNKYLNMQRANVKLMKRQLWQERKAVRSDANKQPNKKKIVQNPRNINFYGAIKENRMEEEVYDEPITKKPLFTYEPGIIVKVLFDEPCVDIKDFKAEMRQYSVVKYVDVKEGDIAAFVRVDCARSAPTLIKHCAPNRCQILTGESESAYWDKINRDREEKLSKAVKIKPKRGREKINKLISNHIRFDE